MSAYLSNCIIFAATYSSSFLIVGRRTFYVDSQYHIDIAQIPRHMIDPLWHLATFQAKMDPQTFLTSDGLMLWWSLRSLGISPHLCRVHLMDESISRIYDITFPKIEKEKKTSNSRHWHSVSTRSPDFAIKIIMNEEDKEIDVLHVIQPDYCLGVLQCLTRV